MAGWSQTIIVGNVGGDPEMRYLQSGVGVCSFSVAVTRRWTDRNANEQREKTTWYRVSCWRNLAETANNLIHKGTQIMVVGNVEARAYLDKSGQPAATIELTADNFQLLGSRADNAGSSGDYAGGQSGGVDDIPF
ncbi:MAG: single-stranded DNA-binding protein [Anaerolineae bacterium]|nr:single-stranded DNA-binding protein [Anaerolineae bacterium]NUQ05851.1 single-stranded DNA-binding protein [Anaerolineae bacterium]